MLSVYNYKDSIKYISDFIEYKKSIDDSFSLRKICKDLNLKSTAPLLDVLKRKKDLKGKLLESFIFYLPIDNSELMYFQAINERSQVKSDKSMLMYDFIINELKPKNETTYSCYRNEKIDLFSHWVYMVILSMANIKNFDLNTDNIRKKLLEELPENEVNEAFFQLFSYGLLKKDKEGNVSREYSDHSNKTDVKSETACEYIKTMCDFAKKALNLSVNQREYQCFSVAMDKANMPLAKEIIRKAKKKIIDLSQEGIQDTVYQTNFIMFPLTK